MIILVFGKAVASSTLNILAIPWMLSPFIALPQPHSLSAWQREPAPEVHVFYPGFTLWLRVYKRIAGTIAIYS